jgi:uncharacterized protein YndB with AHSA1/START domain
VTVETGNAVRRELEIAARPETVWEFLVDPVRALRWMGVEAHFDARPGGEYVVEVLPGHTARGEFVELDPPRWLAYTWGWDADGAGPSVVPPGTSRVEFELVPQGDGTLLRFTHELPDAGAAERHAAGWDHYLGRLASAASGGEPGRDEWLDGGA